MNLTEFLKNKQVGESKRFFVNCLKPLVFFSCSAVPLEILMQSGITDIPVILSGNIPEDSLPAFKKLCRLSEVGWCLGVHWFYKKQFNNKYRMPGSNKLNNAKNAEPIGDFLWGIYSLTSDIHACSSDFSDKYKNASDWSAKIVEEYRLYSWSKIDRVFTAPNKKEYVKEIETILNKLKCEINPFCKDAQPHFWELIEATLEIFRSNYYPNLQAKHWVNKQTRDWRVYKGFLGSFSRLNQLIKSPSAKVMHIKDGKLILHTGNKSTGTKGEYLIVNTSDITVSIDTEVRNLYEARVSNFLS